MNSYKLSSRDSPPALTSPFLINFSKNGSYLTYLYPDSTGNRQVYSINLSKSYDSLKAFDADASNELSLEEQLRRERMRLFARGVTSYEWVECAQDSRQLMMIPLNGQIFISEFGLSVTTLRIVYNGDQGAAIDPHWSPDGKKIAFVINRDLFVIDVAYEDDIEKSVVVPKRLTFAGEVNAGISCGLADYIAQEEMDR